MDEAFSLLAVGMTVVFLFLVMMSVIISLTGKIIMKLNLGTEEVVAENVSNDGIPDNKDEHLELVSASIAIALKQKLS